MTISIELIDELRRRTNCSYEEAKVLLEKHNGDLVEAIVEFERKNSSNFKNNHNNNVNFRTKLKQLIKKGFKTKFVIEKSGETIINIPVNIFILLALIFNWFLLAALVISFILGCRFKIHKEKGENIDLNAVIYNFGNKMKEAAGEAKQQNGQNHTKDNDKSKNNDDDDDSGYNEITVE